MKNKEAQEIIYITLTLNMLKNVNVLFGGRGLGKTFNILREMVTYVKEHPDKKFIWLRDTDKTIQKIAAGQSLTSPIENDFKKHPDRYSYPFPHIEFRKSEGAYTFAEIYQDGSVKYIYGYLMALSTFHNARGVDYSDVDFIIMDEFIPEEGTVARKHQGTTFLNMYETVNRNRELEGLPPVKIILLTNTNDIYSDILESLGLAEIIENMVLNNLNKYLDDDIWIEFLANKRFQDAKAKTLLYRINNNYKFNQMALNNKFTISTTLIQKQPDLKSSKGILVLDNRYTLLQLRNGTYFWINRVYKDLVNYDMDNDQEAILFRLMFTDKLRKSYIIGKMFFDSIYTQRNVLDYAKI